MLPFRRALSSSASSATALLHRSRIPTMHFQDSLPKLPLPKLEDTLQQMLYSAEAITTPEELAEARMLADDFAAGEGPALQAELVARDARQYSSFISEPWFEMYLRDSRPLLLNHNPQLTFNDEDARSIAGDLVQSDRAARMVHGAMTFARTLEADLLEPDVFHTAPQRSKTRLFEEVVRLLPRGIAFYGAAACGAYPLDMSQYANLLRSTRLPGPEIDRLQVSPGTRHIAVLRGGTFWSLDVLDEDGATIPLPEVQAGLQAIIDAADSTPVPVASEDVGLLTTLDRRTWAGLRERLHSSDPTNAASLESIDSALFVLALDDASPTEPLEVSSTFLHGKGGGRWYDKSFTLIVTANGKAAINFEHAWGDGVAVLRFCNEIHAASTAMPSVSTPQTPRAPPTALAFKLPNDIKTSIADAQRAFDATLARTDQAMLRVEHFNSAALKAAKLSPDGAMQMAFQLAHAHMHGGPLPSTYESGAPPKPRTYTSDLSLGPTPRTYTSDLSLGPTPRT